MREPGLPLQIERSYELGSQTDLAQQRDRLTGQGEEFPLAGSVALMLLRATGTDAIYEQLASSADPASRELAAEGLCELHVDEPERVRSILGRLMASDLDEARHTALKAAYNIGPDARQLLGLEHAQ